MKPSRVVLDSSALLDAADEAHPSWGLALRSLHAAYPVEAPALLASEVGNVVHRVRPKVFGASHAERVRVLEVLLSGIALQPSDPEHRRVAARLVDEFQLSFYDAEFLALAMRNASAVLVTHDRALRAAATARLTPLRSLDLDAVHAAFLRGEL